MAIEAIDMGHSYIEVNAKYGILKSSLTEHMIGKTRIRKMGPKGVLLDEEHRSLCEYIEEMANSMVPLIPTQVKTKVEQMIQSRLISFKNEILGKSWMLWFRHRHLELTLENHPRIEAKKS